MANTNTYPTPNPIDFQAMEQEARQSEAQYNEQLQALKACLDDLRTLETNNQLDTTTIEKINQAIEEAQTQISAIELAFGTAPSKTAKKAHRYHQVI